MCADFSCFYYLYVVICRGGGVADAAATALLLLILLSLKLFVVCLLLKTLQGYIQLCNLLTITSYRYNLWS
jgi:hypothetical protein